MGTLRMEVKDMEFPRMAVSRPLNHRSRTILNRLSMVLSLGLVLTAFDVNAAAVLSEPQTSTVDEDVAVYGRTSPDVDTPPPMQLRRVWSGGMFRWYWVHEPVGYNSAEPSPVVLAFHGGMGNARRFADNIDLYLTADQENFLLVFPEGTGNFGGPPDFLGETWNAGNCCGYAQEQNIDDVLFVRRMVTKLASEWNVDVKRVFATGHSNGAMMTYRLGIEAPDLIRAIAPNAGALGVGGLPAAPMPVMAMHGRLDSNVPWQGGKGDGSSGTSYTSQRESLLPFIIVNGATSLKRTEIRGAAIRFEAIAPNSGEPIVYWWLRDGGHSWPGHGGSVSEPTNNDIDANEELWMFFSQF